MNCEDVSGRDNGHMAQRGRTAEGTEGQMKMQSGQCPVSSIQRNLTWTKKLLKEWPNYYGATAAQVGELVIQ